MGSLSIVISQARLSIQQSSAIVRGRDVMENSCSHMAPSPAENGIRPLALSEVACFMKRGGVSKREAELSLSLMK